MFVCICVVCVSVWNRGGRGERTAANNARTPSALLTELLGALTMGEVKVTPERAATDLEEASLTPGQRAKLNAEMLQARPLPSARATLSAACAQSARLETKARRRVGLRRMSRVLSELLSLNSKEQVFRSIGQDARAVLNRAGITMRPSGLEALHVPCTTASKSSHQECRWLCLTPLCAA